MDNSVRGMSIRQFSQNRFLAPVAEGYGIEVEVEGLTDRGRAAAERSVHDYWGIKDDGSLRNNGAEFVSNFLYPDDLTLAVDMLYTTKRNWHPSERTGIHVHANMLHLTVEQLYRVLQYYAFVEPLLFTWAEQDREENIFCVPWYRAAEEADRVAAAVRRGNLFDLNRCCKYSGLYCQPVLTFGTIEFRHASTFEHASELHEWLRVVRAVANSWTMPDPIILYARHGAAYVARQCLGSLVDRVSDDDLDGAIESCGAAEVALLFTEPSYKFGEWGEPGSFLVSGDGHSPRNMDEPEDFFDSIPAPVIRERDEDEDEDDEYREEDDEYIVEEEPTEIPDESVGELVARARAQLRANQQTLANQWLNLDHISESVVRTTRGDE